MAINTATRAGLTKPSAAGGLALDVKRAWGTIEVTSNPTIGDTFVMVKLPKGAMITGGSLEGDKLDSTGSGSACLTINIGVDKAVTAADGTAVTASSTSNALASAWALGPDAAAVTGYKPDSNVRKVPLGSLLLTNGPLYTSDECNAVVTVLSSAVAFATGTLTLFVDYYQASS